MNETRYAGVAQLVEQLICNQQVGGSSPSTSSTISASEYGRFPEWPKGADCKSVVNDFGGSNPPPPTKRQSIERCSVLFYSQNLEWEQWIRKPALGNMLDACCNRRGFSAEKRIHHLPPKKRVQICALFCFVRKTKKARIRANLKSHASWYQPSLSLRDISPRGRDKFGRVRANKFAPTSRLSPRESWHLRSK